MRCDVWKKSDIDNLAEPFPVLSLGYVRSITLGNKPFYQKFITCVLRFISGVYQLKRARNSMPKNIAAPPSSPILMSTLPLKNVLNMVMKALFDSSFGQRIKTLTSTKHTFNLTQHKSWHGIAYAQQVLEQLDVVHSWLQQFGFLAMSGIR